MKEADVFVFLLEASSIKTKVRENLAVISNLGYVGRVAFTYILRFSFISGVGALGPGDASHYWRLPVA